MITKKSFPLFATSQILLIFNNFHMVLALETTHNERYLISDVNANEYCRYIVLDPQLSINKRLIQTVTFFFKSSVTRLPIVHFHELSSLCNFNSDEKLGFLLNRLSFQLLNVKTYAQFLFHFKEACVDSPFGVMR